MEEKNMGAGTPKLKKNMGAGTPKLKQNMGARTPKQNMGAGTPQKKTWKPGPQKIRPRGPSIEVFAWTPETGTPKVFQFRVLVKIAKFRKFFEF